MCFCMHVCALACSFHPHTGQTTGMVGAGAFFSAAYVLALVFLRQTRKSPCGDDMRTKNHELATPLIRAVLYSVLVCYLARYVYVYVYVYVHVHVHAYVYVC